MDRTTFVTPTALGALIALASVSFGLAGASGAVASGTSASWLSPSWTCRMAITIPPDSIEGTSPLPEFTVLLRPGVSQAPLFAHARADGADLRITKDDGLTVLPIEVVSFDPDAMEAEIWFQADVLSKSAGSFYLYYGNPLPDSTAGSSFASNYLAVYHMADDPGGGILRDSGPNGNDAVPGLNAAFTSGDVAAGTVGQAWAFNGTTHWIDGDGIASTDSSHTVSAWVACWDQFKPNDADFLFNCTGGWRLAIKRNDLQRCPDYATEGTQQYIWDPRPLPDTLAHHYVWAMDGVNDTIRFYFDGAEQNWVARIPSAGLTYTGQPIGGNIGIGSSRFGFAGHHLQGLLDEFRIYDGVRSPEWIKTEYRNQKSPDGFVQFGPEQQPTHVGVDDPSGIRPVLAQNVPNPLAFGTRIAFSIPGAGPTRLEVIDISGRSVAVLVDRSLQAGDHVATWNGRDRSGARAAPGVYFYRLHAPGVSASRKMIVLP